MYVESNGRQVTSVAPVCADPSRGQLSVPSGSGCSPPGPGARNENIFTEENLCPAFGKIMGGQRDLSVFAAFYCLQFTKNSYAKVA